MSRFAAVVDSTAADQRIDAFLAALGEPFASRSHVQRLIAEGCVTVNGVVCGKPSLKLQPGDHIEARLPAAQPSHITPQAIPLDIVYEDDEIVVVNKARGMVVHPAPGNPDSTLVNALLAHVGRLPGIGGVARPGIVHRLDKQTSGLLVVAKTAAAHIELARQIKERSMKRHYVAFVHGVPKVDAGTIDAPIGRHPVDRQRMAVLSVGGRPAVTHFRVLERYRGFAKMEARLQTGRTHQIRVHLSHMGHPLVGDHRYGAGRSTPFDGGQALHAYRLGLMHPTSGEALTFEVPLPPELVELRERLLAATASKLP